MCDFLLCHSLHKSCCLLCIYFVCVRMTQFCQSDVTAPKIVVMSLSTQLDVRMSSSGATCPALCQHVRSVFGLSFPVSCLFELTALCTPRGCLADVSSGFTPDGRLRIVADRWSDAVGCRAFPAKPASSSSSEEDVNSHWGSGSSALPSNDCSSIRFERIIDLSPQYHSSRATAWADWSSDDIYVSLPLSLSPPSPNDSPLMASTDMRASADHSSAKEDFIQQEVAFVRATSPELVPRTVVKIGQGVCAWSLLFFYVQHHVHRKSISNVTVLLLGVSSSRHVLSPSRLGSTFRPFPPPFSYRHCHPFNLQRNVQPSFQMFSFVLYTSSNTQDNAPSTHTRSTLTCPHVSRLNPAFPFRIVYLPRFIIYHLLVMPCERLGCDCTSQKLQCTQRSIRTAGYSASSVTSHTSFALSLDAL